MIILSFSYGKLMHLKIYKIIPIYYLVNKYDFTMEYKNILEDDSEPNAYKRWIL